MHTKISLVFIVALMTFLFSCKNSGEEAEQQKVKLGTMGLSIETPLAFKKINIEEQLSPEVRKKIKAIEAFTNEENGDYYAINMAEYAYDVNFSRTAAANGALMEMNMRYGGKISNRKDETRMINGNEAATISAIMTDKNNNKLNVQTAILNKGNIMYQIVCMYRNENKKETVTQLIESLTINK
jgi:hypothetical protein